MDDHIWYDGYTLKECFTNSPSAGISGLFLSLYFFLKKVTHPFIKILISSNHALLSPQRFISAFCALVPLKSQTASRSTTPSSHRQPGEECNVAVTSSTTLQYSVRNIT